MPSTVSTTLDRIKAFNPLIPVIMLSAQDKIEVAVNCMKHKAFDYIVKSETAFLRLSKSHHDHLPLPANGKSPDWYMEKM